LVAALRQQLSISSLLAAAVEVRVTTVVAAAVLAALAVIEQQVDFPLLLAPQ